MIGAIGGTSSPHTLFHGGIGMIIDLGNKYIHFELYHDTGKTQQWKVRNKTSIFCLGFILWESRWRQYVFCPSENSEFNNGCLDTIIQFMDRLNKEKRIK